MAGRKLKGSEYRWAIHEEHMSIFTPWGRVYVQSESELCSRTRFHYPEWATRFPDRKPLPRNAESLLPTENASRKRAWAQLKRWAHDMGCPKGATPA